MLLEFRGLGVSELGFRVQASVIQGLRFKLNNKFMFSKLGQNR